MYSMLGAIGIQVLVHELTALITMDPEDELSRETGMIIIDLSQQVLNS